MGRGCTADLRAAVAPRGGDTVADHLVADLLRTADEFARSARLSGVSKTTLYRWWPSAGALALDGYFHAVEEPLAFEDTGDLRADLTSQLRAFARILTRTPAGRVVTELIGQSQTDHDLAAAFRSLYSSERRRLAGERLLRAREQGQIREDVDVQVLVDQLWGAVYHRLLIPDEPVTDDFVVALVSHLIDGITPPAPPRPTVPPPPDAPVRPRDDQ
ncbi:TetR/AcrR family transcriptional regulator C-terminal ligand-binding domain-containing protein [Streptomyces chromofuscus]|uniref:TetR/AcrR family transcriptional regulator C-terminal ligand-binding domain-containing protein n=1 Tax=Streptomyces chromofuscus TaxID=42881 RepID=A0A7M2TIX5_STRCW|nr:TetR/AcrR family transcriptional regulator C-terminal ligand-binding domain-containing protein [Streptomyces chromofuscus]